MQKLKSIAPFIVTGTFVALLTVSWFHRFYIYDSFRLLNFEPSIAVQKIAAQAGLSADGQRLFYAAQPILLDGPAFQAECTFADLSLVLGCYSAGNIYLLDVTEQRLEAVETVTAGHEMLHVVYARLSSAELTMVHRLLDTEMQNISNARILDELDEYRNDPTADLYNEMHSIFATEEKELIPELEEHYDRYFSDRSSVIDYSTEYEKVFVEIDDKVKAFDKDLQKRDIQINNLLDELNSLANSIEAESVELERLREEGEIAQYNNRVPGYNASLGVYELKANTYEARIVEYNEIVRKRNKVQLEGRELIENLDSSL